MGRIPTLEEYTNSLGRLTAHVDPTASTPEAASIRQAASTLNAVEVVDIASLAAWVQSHPRDANVLGLAVGMSQEKFKNALKDKFDTTGWITLARRKPLEFVTWLDEEFDLVRLVSVQRYKTYEFGDLLVARAGGRASAVRAGASGRSLEDEIEAIALDLGLKCATRTRFTGTYGRTAPCDLVLPAGGEDAQIAVAAKGFDSTGSKLSDAVREIEEMAAVRKPTQYIFAVVDGIGWKSRGADLRRLYAMWETDAINGLYTLATMDEFRSDLLDAARMRKLIE